MPATHIGAANRAPAIVSASRDRMRMSMRRAIDASLGEGSRSADIIPISIGIFVRIADQEPRAAAGVVGGIEPQSTP